MGTTRSGIVVDYDTNQRARRLAGFAAGRRFLPNRQAVCPQGVQGGRQSCDYAAKAR